MISAEQFEEWKQHPVTKEVLVELKKSRKNIVTQLSLGNTIGHDAESTLNLTSKAVGQLEGINQLLNISFEGSSISDDNDIDELSGY